MVKKTKSRTDKETAKELPTIDFAKLLEHYKLPSVDFKALLEREKKNIEALTEANKIAYEGWAALVHRQSEILQETMAQTIAMARKRVATERADLANEGFKKALENMRELAQMAAKSQKEAFETVRKRIDEAIEEMRDRGKK